MMYFISLSSQLSAIYLKFQVAVFDLKIHTFWWYSPRAQHSMAVAISRCVPSNSLPDEQDTAHHELTMILYLSSSSQSSNMAIWKGVGIDYSFLMSQITCVAIGWFNVCLQNTEVPNTAAGVGFGNVYSSSSFSWILQTGNLITCVFP